jgi:type IV pilus assembly protein PilB
VAVSGGGKRLWLGEILIKAGLINDEQLGIGLNKQKQTREPIGEILIKLGFVTEDQIRHALELQYGVKSISLKGKIPLEIVRLLPESLIRQHLILPVGISHMTIAMVDPTNFMALDDVRLRLKGVYIEPVVVSESEFHEYLKQLPKAEAARMAMPTQEAKPESRPVPVPSMDENNPATAATNLLNNAIRRHASEVIVEPQEAETIVRYRVDGFFQKETLSAKMAQPLVSRFKVQADINPGQVPQSGSFVYNYEGRNIKVFLNSIRSNRASCSP